MTPLTRQQLQFTAVLAKHPEDLQFLSTTVKHKQKSFFLPTISTYQSIWLHFVCQPFLLLPKLPMHRTASWHWWKEINWICREIKEQNKIPVKSRDRKLIISYNIKNKLKSENERKPRMINVNFVNRTPQMSNFELVLWMGKYVIRFVTRENMIPKRGLNRNIRISSSDDLRLSQRKITGEASLLLSS